MKNKLITIGISIGPCFAILYLILFFLAILGIDVTLGINSTDFGILLFITLIGTGVFSFILNIYAVFAIRGENKRFLKRYWIPFIYYLLIFAYFIHTFFFRHFVGPEGGFVALGLLLGSLISIGIAVTIAFVFIITHKIIKRKNHNKSSHLTGKPLR